MYSKRVVHKAYVDGNAYITVGDPFVVANGNPFRAPVKGEKLKNFDIPVRFIFVTYFVVIHSFIRSFVIHFFRHTLTTSSTQRIPKNAEQGNFSKLTYAAGGYTESNKYKPVAGDDRKGFGFGSKDASRRDEFSNTIRTEQYRAQLLKEQQIVAKTTQNNLKELTSILEKRMGETSGPETKSPSKTTGFNYDDKCPQYDIGRVKVTPFDPRSKTDSFYKFDGEGAGMYIILFYPIPTLIYSESLLYPYSILP